MGHSLVVADRTRAAWGWWGASLLLLTGLTALAWKLTKTVPTWSPQLRAIEFPVYAVALGLLAGGALSLLGLREKLGAYFRTEFFLKTGLVLLGASINLSEIAAFGLKGLVQAVLLITSVFFFTWHVARWLGVEEKLRALLAASVAICGVSAAITAAGAVLARKEQLAYVSGLVIFFALPLMFLQPALATWINLAPSVAGAWIGGNIDTTAAVVGAGALHSQQAMKVASIAKMSQNALIGVVAFALALYWVAVVERAPGRRPSGWEIWHRFPKFVLGFVFASVLMSLASAQAWVGAGALRDLRHLREWLFMAAFLSIGFGFSFSAIREAGWRPVVVYGLATVFNTLTALAVAILLFG
jgi:uncharacterized integral membrane protein (TIGR00698 family)